jgi:hypothetical protein
VSKDSEANSDAESEDSEANNDAESDSGVESAEENEIDDVKLSATTVSVP